MRYIALLRGINISGKNKISMPDLKTALIEKGFEDACSRCKEMEYHWE